MEAELQQRIAAATENGVALLAALRERITTLALPGEPVTIPAFEAARFTLEHDLYNSQQTLMASFYASPHYRNGVLLFHCDYPFPALGRKRLPITATEFCCSIATVVVSPSSMSCGCIRRAPHCSSRRWKRGCAMAKSRPTHAWR